MACSVQCQACMPVVEVDAHVLCSLHVKCRAQVPNIKFNVAKMLERLVPLVDAAVAERAIRPCLLELAEDPDVDVRFFAHHALAACDAVTAA